MSQSNLITPRRGIIGKEFLINEDLLISNYNPFYTANTSGPSGLKEDTILTGKLYIFNKKEFREPTKEEFQNIKSVVELTTSPYKLILDASLNFVPISILTKWDENLDKRTFELVSNNSIQDINPILSNGLGIEEYIKDNNRNLLGTFVVFVVDHNISTGKLNKKNYTDLPTNEQFFMYMIPSEYIEIATNFNPETSEFLGLSFSLQDTSKLHLEAFNLPISINDDTKVKLIINKLGKRIKEECLTNLFVKQSQTLTYNSKPITFILNKDEQIGINNPEIQLEENTLIAIFPKEIIIFLNWLKELMNYTLLDKYNDYLTYNGSKNINNLYDIFIPELIFNILGTKKLIELNVKIFIEYFYIYPPSETIDPNNELNINILKKLLPYFYTNKMYSRDNKELNNKTSLVFNSNGLNFPDFSRINFNINRIDYKYIFIPQRTKIFETSKNLLKNKTILTKNIHLYAQYYSNIVSGIKLTKKVDEIKDFYGIEFDYYISPNGNDANTGKTPTFPKATLTNLPVGSKVLLLPGEYKAYTYPAEVLVSQSGHGPETRLSYRKIHPTVFYNMPNDLRIYGCGNDTIINYEANLVKGSRYDSTGLGTRYSWYQLFYPFSNTTRTKIFNISFKTNITLSHTYDPYHFKFGQSIGIEYYNCIFLNQNIYSEEGPSFKNCIFEGGVRLGSINPSTSFNHSDEDKLFIENPLNYIRYNKKLNEFLLNSFNIEPMYTLIPIGNQDEENVIQLETTTNITTITNLNYKLL